MGLENLRSVFNDISENGDFREFSEKGVHDGLTNEFPSQPSHPEWHSALDDLIEIGRIETRQDPSPLMGEDKLTHYSSFITGNKISPQLGYSGIFNADVTNPTLISREDTEIRRKDLSFTFGDKIRLGKGKLIFDTLYNKNHSANENRVTFKVGQQTINTLRAGVGSLGNLDIKGNSTLWRTGLGFLAEPYIVHNIPESGFGSFAQGAGQNRDFIPWRAAADDLGRLASFYTSPAGIAFIAKENVTNALIGDGVTLGEPLGFTMAPPIPFPNTGFLNFLQQSVQGASLIPGGGSARRPFKLQYSNRGSVGVLPLAIQGDNTLGMPEYREIKISPKGTKTARKGLEKLKDALIAKLAHSVQVPQIGKSTPFIDLTGPGNHSDKTKFLTRLHGYDDKISIRKAENTKEADDNIAEEGKGDFYVRIKDLRGDGNYIYFRGYVTGITENVTPTFTPTNYIGRSEPVYLYERGERDLSFNLRVYPANQAEFEVMYDKIEKLTSLAYPEYFPEHDSKGKTLVRMKAPFTELYMAHIGSRAQGQFGFIKSITYTVNETGDWDQLTTLPRLFDIAISYQILNRKPPSMDSKFYRLESEEEKLDLSWLA